MKIKFLFYLFILLSSCKNKNFHEVNLFDNYNVCWDNKERWILKDESYYKIKKNIEIIEPKLIKLLKDTTSIMKVCFKEKPLKKGDIALICLFEMGQSAMLYDPNMIEIKKLDTSDSCYFVLFNHIQHLENNREEYSNFILKKYKHNFYLKK